MLKFSCLDCENGMIPYFLSNLYQGQSEPLKWVVDVEECIKTDGRNDGGNTYMVDLKPNQSDNISLYELKKVVGISHGDWSPIMLVLTGILVDEDPAKYNKRKFSIDENDMDYPIFSLMYLRGSIKDGKLTGTWNTAGPAAANSLLLWPEDFDYFITEKNKLTLT